jgi:hypothetical protein
MIFASYAFEVLSSFASNNKIWSWMCRANIWWRFQFEYFEQTTNTNEIVKELVIRELLICKHYQM